MFDLNIPLGIPTFFVSLTKEKRSKKENRISDNNNDMFYFSSFIKLKVMCYVSSLL
jgi:hypothetical protein